MAAVQAVSLVVAAEQMDMLCRLEQLPPGPFGWLLSHLDTPSVVRLGQCSRTLCIGARDHIRSHHLEQRWADETRPCAGFPPTRPCPARVRPEREPEACAGCQGVLCLRCEEQSQRQCAGCQDTWCGHCSDGEMRECGDCQDEHCLKDCLEECSECSAQLCQYCRGERECNRCSAVVCGACGTSAPYAGGCGWLCQDCLAHAG